MILDNFLLNLRVYGNYLPVGTRLTH